MTHFINGRILRRCFAAWIVCIGLTLLSPTLGLGNSVTTTYNSLPSNACSEETKCCIQFNITIDESTDEFIIKLLSDVSGASDTCFDWDCFEDQVQNIGGTFTYIGNGHFRITFNPARNSGNYTLYLCPKFRSSTCILDWTAMTWDSKLSGTENDGGTEPLYNCNAGNCDGDCDILRVYAADGMVFCLTRMQNFTASSVTMTFTPQLQGCNDIRDFPPCWGSPNVDNLSVPGSTIITWTLPLIGCDDLDPCEQFCVKIGSCAPPNTNNFTVSMTADPNGNTCSTRTVVMKPTADGGTRVEYSDGEVQNFPNPLTRANAFKTKIPFTAKHSGEVLLRLINSAGSTVLTQSMTVGEAGPNYFDFSAEDLAPGTYCYVVESPVGVAVVSKTMLVIK
jgi:hypothetical protein